MRKCVIEYAYESFCRDTYLTVPTFDFYFKVMLPKANKERIILKRDGFGRIISTAVPTILSYNNAVYGGKRKETDRRFL